MNDILLRDGVILPGETIAHMLGHGDTRYTPEWFTALPAMVDVWCERWQITLLPEIPSLSYTVVLFGTSTITGDVVLKLAPPEMEFSAEIAGLTAFQGPGVVRLLHADREFAGMLMQRVLPGTPLRAFDDRIDDATATTIGSDMLKRVWRPAPTDHGDLIPLSRWFRDLYRLRDQIRDGRSGLSVSRESVEFAVALADTLLDSHEATVLHGDMHHGNILENGHGGWTVIDPKGLVGDRAYDVGTWLLNGWPENEPGDPESILRRRVEIFTRELGLSRAQVLTGALVHFMLCVAWSTVDASPTEQQVDQWLAGTVRAFTIAEQIAREDGMLA